MFLPILFVFCYYKSEVVGSLFQHKGSHDWFCFDCHQPGEVLECGECWRVYHPACTEEDWEGGKFICAVCAVRS